MNGPEQQVGVACVYITFCGHSFSPHKGKLNLIKIRDCNEKPKNSKLLCLVWLLIARVGLGGG